MATAWFLLPTQKMDIFVLGAIMALLIIHGITSEGFDPLVLYYFVHGCDLHLLCSDIVGVFHPKLQATVKDWITTGPAGNVGPFQGDFSTFHHIQMSSLGSMCITHYIDFDLDTSPKGLRCSISQSLIRSNAI